MPASYLGRFDDVVPPTLSGLVDGPTIGGGFEYRLSSRLSVFGEYRFTAFLDHNFHYGEAFQSSTIPNGAYVFSDRYGADIQSLRVGLAYRPFEH